MTLDAIVFFFHDMKDAYFCFLDWNVRQAAMGTIGRTKGSQGKVNVFVAFFSLYFNETVIERRHCWPWIQRDLFPSCCHWFFFSGSGDNCSLISASLTLLIIIDLSQGTCSKAPRTHDLSQMIYLFDSIFDDCITSNISFLRGYQATWAQWKIKSPDF